MPETQSVLVLLFRVNQKHLRSLAHSVADHEFKQVWTDANHIARQLVIQLQRSGGKALNMPTGFAYEAPRWPGKMWLTCDKVFAVEAGLGQRPGGQTRFTCDRRQSNLDRIPGRGDPFGARPGVAQDQNQRLPQIDEGVCQVLPLVSGCNAGHDRVRTLARRPVAALPRGRRF